MSSNNNNNKKQTHLPLRRGRAAAAAAAAGSASSASGQHQQDSSSKKNANKNTTTNMSSKNNTADKNTNNNTKNPSFANVEEDQIYFTDDYDNLVAAAVPELVDDDEASLQQTTTAKYESLLLNSSSFQQQRSNHHQLLSDHQSADKSRQNGCLVRPQRILSQKRFHNSIERASKNKHSTSSIFQQQEKLLTTIVNNNNKQQQQPQNNNNITAMMRKVMASAYGHGTNGVRVVSGKLKTLVVSWLGALEGSHLGHLLRSEYFGTLSTTTSKDNNNNTNNSGVLAEPASRRALCCVAVRYNKGYADYISSGSSEPPSASVFFDNLTGFQVVGYLSMDEPILELTFPDGDGEGCAGVGTEIALFYTPGLNLGIGGGIYSNITTTASTTGQDAAPKTVSNDQQVLNPLLTANGELRCSLCIELTYTSVVSTSTSNESSPSPLRVQEASLIPHDDNSWIPLRGWVARMLREKKRINNNNNNRNQNDDDEDQEEPTVVVTTTTTKEDAALNNDNKTTAKNSASPQRLHSPLFGALKTSSSALASKLSSKTKNNNNGDSGLDYDSEGSSSSASDNDDDEEIVDFNNFKLTSTSKPGTDECS